MQIASGEAIPGGVMPVFLYASAGMVSGLLLVPSVIFSLARLRGKEIAIKWPDRWWLRPTIWIFGLPVILLVGFFASKNDNISWILIPIMHILAIGIPVVWFLYLGVRGLPVGSQQRQWGVFGSGLVLGPFLIMMGEMAALGIAVAIVAVLLSGQPDLLQEITEQVQWMMDNVPTQEQIVEMAAPFITQPAVLLVVFIFATALVPLIEEALKPIGVWLLAGRRITPVGGFTAGIISGAGYAFFESMALSSGSEEWIMVVVARFGTAVIHILTTGLMGWAIVSAWRSNRYTRLGFVYLGMVTLHGLWNGLTLFTAYTVLAGELVPDMELPGLVSGIGDAAPFALGLLSIGAFIVLLWINYTLRNATQPAQSEEVKAVDSPSEL